MKKHTKRNGNIAHPLYSRYRGMIARCTNPNNIKYHNYGGRGIKVCDRWLYNFLNFVNDMGECPSGYELDRIDFNGNYEPGNCRWVSKYEQMSNMSTNKEHVGVSWNDKMHKWLARIQIKGKSVYLGSFLDIQDAINAREQAYQLVK